MIKPNPRTIDLRSNVKLWSEKVLGTHLVWQTGILEYGGH